MAIQAVFSRWLTLLQFGPIKTNCRLKKHRGGPRRSKSIKAKSLRESVQGSRLEKLKNGMKRQQKEAVEKLAFGKQTREARKLE